MNKTRDRISFILNLLIVIFVVMGNISMFMYHANGGGLMSRGFRNFRYFTVLSNELCGIIALLWILFFLLGKRFPVLPKYMAATAVALTFVIVGAFLAPMNPQLNLYQGGNFWFHLIVPLTGIAEFILVLPEKTISFRSTWLAAGLSLVYGLFYLINILINGVGKWPDTNDWYGFLTWGYPMGFAIFAFVILMHWGIACLLRFLNRLANRKRVSS